MFSIAVIDLGQISEIILAIPVALGMLWYMAIGTVKLGRIFKEVTPNGGESLADRIGRLENADVEKFKILGEHTKILDSQNQQLTRMENKLNRICPGQESP